ncbi:phosphatase PAP2 family protein [Actinoplanes derwentensis]|uniref:Undecaprenyl-diphosphatase n=1 Tax=Actinoplanes derwentensis TaxID=113562 RepID=A0A1H1XCN9_9ACTN|nr:phosphatase PAP2 family protein [Actinoplanes derwentensis]GID87134.1 phosphatase PAP2 family protein [Actinoplanes derwentensis]SDT06922.1 undecaprenyl-diphosphatase [Actinoplanes derwentensis]
MGLQPPEFSTEVYRLVVGIANRSPESFQWFMEHFTEVSIVLLVGIVVWLWWRARHASATMMALSVLAPAAGVIAYLTSEVVKTVLAEERPCRAVGLPIVAAECPPVGDWSFPSNHSTIAGALFIAAFLVSWRWGLVALPIATLAAFSRVFVGVHYPHDVLTGYLLGSAVTAVVTLLLARPGARLVEWGRSRPALGWALGPGLPVPRPAVSPREYADAVTARPSSVGRWQS